MLVPLERAFHIDGKVSTKAPRQESTLRAWGDREEEALVTRAEGRKEGGRRWEKMKSKKCSGQNRLKGDFIGTVRIAFYFEGKDPSGCF